jgi:hypothetical protein
MSFELNLEGGFGSNSKDTNERVSSSPPKTAQGLQKNAPVC